MSYYGSHKIDDYLTFVVNTHKADTGAATDGDGVPTYRVYEDETATPIVTGSMAKLDDAGTTGFYSERIQLTAASGHEKGKSYNIYIEVTVNSIVGTVSHNYQIEAEVDANTVSGSVGTVTGNVNGSVGSVTGAVGSVAGNVDGSVGSLTGHTNQTGDSYGIVNSATYGNAKLAKTGADSDTLKSLSDQVDSVATTTELDKVPKSDGSAVWNPTAQTTIQAKVDAALDASSTELASIPTSTGSLRKLIQGTYAKKRNKSTLNKSTGVETLFKEDSTTTLGTATHSDDDTTFTRGEMN